MENKGKFIQIWNTLYNKSYLETLYWDLDFAKDRLDNTKKSVINDIDYIFRRKNRIDESTNIRLDEKNNNNFAKIIDYISQTISNLINITK